MDKEKSARLNSPKEILGEATIFLLQQERHVSPETLYTLISSWEKHAETQQKPAYQEALKILVRKMN